MASDKYVLAGWEYNNFWKLAEFYRSDSAIIGLDTTHEAYEATTFPYAEAEIKRQHLQSEYSDFGWYLLRLNPPITY